MVPFRTGQYQLLLKLVGQASDFLFKALILLYKQCQLGLVALTDRGLPIVGYVLQSCLYIDLGLQLLNHQILLLHFLLVLLDLVALTATKI